jgi:hypothetical protein
LEQVSVQLAIRTPRNSTSGIPATDTQYYSRWLIASKKGGPLSRMGPISRQSLATLITRNESPSCWNRSRYNWPFVHREVLPGRLAAFTVWVTRCSLPINKTVYNMVRYAISQVAIILCILRLLGHHPRLLRWWLCSQAVVSNIVLRESPLAISNGHLGRPF